MSNSPVPAAKSHPVTLDIFSRLQSYWPNPAASTHAHRSTPPPTRSTGAQQPRFLKIRMVTWNMHDSLPKGDLEELFGKVPSYSGVGSAVDGFPVLPDDENHPYHIIVVAGQECPTLSGIPMGLGAGLWRHEREKEKEKEREEEKAKERGREGGKGREGTKGKGEQSDSPKLPRDKEEAKRKKGDEDTPHDHPPYGWTSMVEDWLCNGGGHGHRNGVPTVADISAPKHLTRRSPSKEPRQGPYQLLDKERLMGIYMAVYIHRDVEELIKGSSKSAVTTGLIGGRVGNKGGVGISINLDGTTLLFLNAHLAAHGSKVKHRLANLSKIKAELAVDSYLRPGDPRMTAEDLTDKFDFTFLCGDLNFRLDITRLHADWLISRQGIWIEAVQDVVLTQRPEYTQALHFDQLKKLMGEGKAFIGFTEGPINFPPTFKYDVLQTLKKTRRGANTRDLAESPFFVSQERGERDCDDAVSIASLSSSSSNSKSGDEHREEADYFVLAPAISTPNVTPSAKPIDKARRRWLGLLSPSSSPSSPSRSSRSSPRDSPALPVTRKSLEENARFNKPDPPFVQRHSFDSRTLHPPTVLPGPTKSVLRNDDQTDDQDKGVYDSSHKQRVPSWCDRILWKSTVQPDPAEDGEEPFGSVSSRSKPRLVQRFVNAMRPLSVRSRSLSHKFTPATASDSGWKAPQSALPSQMVQLPSSSPIHSQPSEYFQPQLPDVSDPKGRMAKGRSSSTSVVPTSTAPATPRPPVRSNTDYSQRRSPRRDSIWRLLPSFLSPSQTTDSPPKSPAISSIPERLPKHRKGDVVCLSYRTLDDRAMRRLEGRSDHRPVIGSYAVYF